MTTSAAQKWLALYFLFVTVGLGTYILIFPETDFLPVGKDEARAAFQIIIPVLLGQLAIIFQWIGQASAVKDDEPSPIPGWAIKAPAISAMAIVMVVIIALVVLNYTKSTRPLATMFSNGITFAVAILNVSIIYLVGRLFPHKKSSVGQTGPQEPESLDEPGH